MSDIFVKREAKGGVLQMDRKELLAMRLQRGAQHRAHRWGYQFEPELETALGSRINEGIERIELQHDLTDEFAISRFEANLSVLVDQMVEHARRERILGELPTRLLDDSFNVVRASFWPFT